MGKDVYPFLIISLLQYAFYFYFLKRIFSNQKIPILIITLVASISVGIYSYFPPKLSNDVYRYLWDGLIQKEGYNPYLYVPGDWKFHDLQEANMGLFRNVDWRDKFTPYPPVAQYIFRGAHSLYQNYGLIGGKLLFVLPLILSAVLLYFLIDKKLYAVFVLNPLLLLEVVANAHLDGWVILFMLLGLYLYRKEKYIPSAIIWALAIATKIYPIIFVPFFIFDLLQKKKYFKVFVNGLLVTGLLYLLYKPYISDSYFAVTHYLTLPNEQEYNASFYRYIYLFFGMETPGVYILAAKICGILFVAASLFLLFIKRFSYNLLLFIGILYLLFSPIVFPWYVLFLLPFVLFQLYEKKDIKIIFLFTIIQLLLTLIYFEPGNTVYREAMLNVEYFLILLLILFYNGVLTIPRLPLSAKSNQVR